MKSPWKISLGHPALLEFRGPDAVRFLNGQLTQDVKKVVGSGQSLPSCVTDAKGKLQFRVDLTEGPTGSLWVSGPEGSAEALEARLTRYLIADDVEVEDLTGRYHLIHQTDVERCAPVGVMDRGNPRYGIPGMDWWIPEGLEVELPLPVIDDDELDALRIENGIPVWGRELAEGMLPPEAGLDSTDISYHKGCYIGQEVISRIKSAGKVNKRLTRFLLESDIPAKTGDVIFVEDAVAGELTSISPYAVDGFRAGLGYLKRGKETGLLKVQVSNGSRHEIKVAD